MRSTLLFLFVSTSVFYSCQSRTIEEASINGTWRSIGSGWVLQIQDSSEYSFYDITSISCLPDRQAELSEIIESLSVTNDSLSFLKGVMTYQFRRIDSLPKPCDEAMADEKKNDPIYNFEVFAETIKTHYAFMELNGIDWESLYQQQKSKLNENSTEAELYTILEETLELLNDNHAYLEANEKVYEALEELSEEKQESTNTENLIEYGDFQIANMVAEQYLIDDMTKDSWLIKWGKMKDNIGFIQVKSMWLFANLDIPQPLIDELGYVDAYVKTFHQLNEGSYIEMETEGVRKIMDHVMSDLSDSQSIILDLRFNGGGQDAVNFEILKRFNSKKRQIVTTKLKYENAFSPILPLHLEASPNAYTNPVYVLTSKQTGSAAEAFAIGSLALPNVKRIGSSTQGALSTALEKKLPNGWSFSISNEVYMDNEGNSYENVGVPADYDLNYIDEKQPFFISIAKDLESDKKSVLRAINELK